MSALLPVLSALLMILIVVGAGAWNALQQVHVSAQSSRAQQAPEPVSATGFVVAMLILMALAILAPIVWLFIALATSPYAL